MNIDFDGPDLTENYRKALSLPKLPGKILHTTEEMTARYLELYREVISNQ